MSLRVALADLSHINEVNRHNLYVPLNVGFIAAYCKKRFGAEIDVALYKDPTRLLEDHRREPFAVVGLGAYYWKEALNKHVATKVKAASPHTSVVVGGPSIDSDHATQERYLLTHPDYDAIIPNEGEVAFGNFVQAILGDGMWESGSIPGVVLRTVDGTIARGAFINLSTDLSEIPSPYLDGTLDAWLGGEWQPLLQTSRLCPYTCAFCVSGKDRGKLRAFPIEQVRDEISYLARRFDGPRDAITYICDENFGIMDRDIAVAEHIAHCRAEHQYPNRVFFYNDKRFTKTSMAVHERLGALCYHGVCLSLQSENPDALKAIHRRNLTDEQVVAALAWAKGLCLKTSTELIFGLPGETLVSYCATVDKCARMGFNVINSYNLILFDGIEMNRPRYREEHKITTVLRPIHGSATMFEDGPVVESEEVVVQADGFTLADFMAVRRLNVMLKAVYALELERSFFEHLVASGRSLSGFLLSFSDPRNPGVSPAHATFVRRLIDVVMRGLYSHDGWAAHLRHISMGHVGLHETSNAFMPHEAYEGGWFRPALEMMLKAWEETDGDCSPDGRAGSERALHPRGG